MSKRKQNHDQTNNKTIRFIETKVSSLQKSVYKDGRNSWCVKDVVGMFLTAFQTHIILMTVIYTWLWTTNMFSGPWRDCNNIVHYMHSNTNDAKSENLTPSTPWTWIQITPYHQTYLDIDQHHDECNWIQDGKHIIQALD